MAIKNRLLAKGYSQAEGIDYFEMFATPPRPRQTESLDQSNASVIGT